MQAMATNAPLTKPELTSTHDLMYMPLAAKQRSRSGALDEPAIPYDGPDQPPPLPWKGGAVVSGGESSAAESLPAKSEQQAAGRGSKAAKEGKTYLALAEPAKTRPEHVGFGISVRDLRAFNVPEADADNQTPTDPYLMIAVLETNAVTLESRVVEKARTSVATGNVVDPEWGEEDDLTLILPAGSPTAVALLNGTLPQLCVSIMDQDDDEDDLLGQAELTLDAPAGEIERMTLIGEVPFPDCAISFTYDITPIVPALAAVITVDSLRIGQIEAIGKPMSTHQRSRNEGGPTGVYLLFSLVEPVLGSSEKLVVEGSSKARSPAARQSMTTANHLRWDDLAWPDLAGAALRLQLPPGGPRPPVLRVELWDADLPDDDMPLARGEVRLGGADKAPASRKVVLSATTGLRDVAVAFRFSMKSMGKRRQS